MPRHSWGPPVDSESFRTRRAGLLSRVELTGPARSRALCELTDQWLLDTAIGAGLASDSDGIELVAVGGYGRRELSPFSDLDLVLLHSRPPPSDSTPDTAAAIAERLWYPIWDSGIRLDHAVRSVDDSRELARHDLVEVMAMLDIRHLAGDRELSRSLRTRVLADWRANSGRRLPELLQMCRVRWERSGDLAFATVGDLKNSRGGLRDLVMMRAVAASWITDCPHEVLDRANAQLLTMRDAVQTATGRPGDRLQLQDQDAIAQDLGLSDRDELLRNVSAIGRAVGQAIDLSWRRVDRALQGPTSAGTVVRRIPLANGVVEHHGEVVLAASAAPADDPVLILRVAAAAAQADLPIGPTTLSRLARLCPPMPVPWPADARTELLRLLGSGPPLIGVWESLDQAGLIAGLIPGWERLRSMPQRDPVHQFTVDRHLVQAVVQAGLLLRRVARPDLLLIAALLHDLGKGTGRDHSVAGAELAEPICRRLGLSDADVELIVILVRHHLLLADTAARRDPDDPATVALVVAAVGTIEVLDLLSALTEADALAAGPNAWTSWKARQVSTLVTRVRTTLADGANHAITQKQMQGEAGSDEAVASASSVPSISGPNPLRVMVQVDPAADGLSVLVDAPDRIGLLADIAKALSNQRLSIRSAAVRTSAGRSIQTWHAAQLFGDPPDPSAVRALLLAALNSSAHSSAVPGRAATAGSESRRSGDRFAAARVAVVPGASERATVIEVRAHDAHGLLHAAARAVAAAGVVVSAALVHTWGAEVVDVLYLQAPDGQPLTVSVASQVAETVRAALTAIPTDAGPR